MWFTIVAGFILIRNFIKDNGTDHNFQGWFILTIWAIILAVKALNLLYLMPNGKTRFWKKNLRNLNNRLIFKTKKDLIIFI